jgi:Afadin- and alpha -actinin-Binding
MEADNLRTASLYINNQLLSRGLLRNGQSIEFARPDKGEGGLEATMGKIMSVVNDLILRRDVRLYFQVFGGVMLTAQRDATQRETLTTTIRTLRADSLRQTTDFERLQGKYVEAQRRLGLAEATERAMKLQMKSAEQAQKGLKEEMGRMKHLVQQTRNQCAVEVRKRERVVEGLKKHVGDGRVRGGGKTVGVREISVVAGVGAEPQQGSTMGVSDEGYDLRSETNEFLTELARGLSEENENMTALVRRTVETLRTLSGCEKEGEVHQEGGMVVPIEMGYENLTQEMDAVIEHLRNLLTNPSFVPLEEVEVREEEIIRLREGWERMESRWREAVQMMDGWRKRMARSGQTVNLEELKMGLMLSPLKPKEEGNTHQLSTLMEEGEGDTQADIDAMEDAEPMEPNFEDDMDESDLSSLFEDEPVEEMEDVSAEQEEQNWTVHSVSTNSVGPVPQLSPLRETSGNRSPAPNPPLTEKDGFTTIVEENTYDLLQLDAPSSGKPKSTPQIQRRNDTPGKLSTPPEDEISLLKTSNTVQVPPSRPSSSSPRKPSRPTPKPASTPRLRTDNSSRLPRPRENAIPQQSPLTMASIAAKLAASEREADAARVRAKLKAARMNRTAAPAQSASDPKSMPPPPRKVGVEEEPVKRAAAFNNADTEATREDGDNDGRSRKRKATGRNQGGRASRRRSTLSPWELESLILGQVGQASPAKGES